MFCVLCTVMGFIKTFSFKLVIVFLHPLPLLSPPSVSPFLFQTSYFCFLVMYVNIVLCAVYNLGATKRQKTLNTCLTLVHFV